MKNKQVIFNYEFMEFKFITRKLECSFNLQTRLSLPQLTNHGRKVLLEPHGVKTNLKEFLNKTKTFRKHYGKYFCLILIVPDDFIETINNLDPEHNAYDFIMETKQLQNTTRKLPQFITQIRKETMK